MSTRANFCADAPSVRARRSVRRYRCFLIILMFRRSVLVCIDGLGSSLFKVVKQSAHALKGLELPPHDDVYVTTATL